VWGKAIEVPVPAALNAIGAEVSSVSCASAGNCAAGGYYHDSSHHLQGWWSARDDGGSRIRAASGLPAVLYDKRARHDAPACGKS